MQRGKKLFSFTSQVDWTYVSSNVSDHLVIISRMFLSIL